MLGRVRSKLSLLSEPKRVASNATIEVGNMKVTNKTANAILVRVQSASSIEVVDCCLEEQGK